MKTPNKVICISGGTMVHIRPHLSICAPAYGAVSNLIYNSFQSNNLKKPLKFEYTNVYTKMADSSSKIETNDDLGDYLCEILEDMTVKCIILAAAVCDFDPSFLIHDNGVDCRIGKDQPRLSSDSTYQVGLTPSYKIISLISMRRPDIILVSFKTTSNESIDILKNKSLKSMTDNDSDLVVGNDIANKYNIITSSDDVVEYSTRLDMIDSLVNTIINKMENE